ncbi:MAG: FHA domain-containing protein [Planctomycetes bacterium]|nr:FHA domain-containing protein [Planctomycetota bacterium]
MSTLSCPRCQAPLSATSTLFACPGCGAPLTGSKREPLVARLEVAGAAPAVHKLGPQTTLGRSPSATIQIVDPEVSRAHTQIEQDGDEYLVRDLGSSNGTYLNGRRLYGPATLEDGDELAIGASKFVFRLESHRPQVLRTEEKKAAVLASVAHEDAFAPADEIDDHATLRRDYDRLRVAHEFNKVIRLERDLHALLPKILDVAFTVIPAENGVILLRDPRSGELLVEAVRQRKQSSAKVLISETLLAHVANTKQGVLTSDASADLRFNAASSIVGLGVRSCMAVPLLTGGKVRGVMFLDSREFIGAFTPKDLEVLSAIASQATIAIENAELIAAMEESAKKKAFLERFLSPALAREVEKGRIELAKGGSLKELTVLFADIRGFTTMSETVPPQETVDMLNEYFELMADCVFEFNGIVDKFIGDSVMALFGAPISGPDDAERAIRCAIRMMETTHEFNAARVVAGKKPIHIGIGLHTGEAVVGVIGSTKRLEYTAVGDTVNVASRLCGAAGGDEIVLSERALGRSSAAFEAEELATMNVRGREATLKTYRIRLGVGG